MAGLGDGGYYASLLRGRQAQLDAAGNGQVIPPSVPVYQQEQRIQPEILQRIMQERQNQQQQQMQQQRQNQPPATALQDIMSGMNGWFNN